MYIRPNNNAVDSIPMVKNDLYRKFRQYFIGATEKEFRQFDSYGREGYVSVNPIIETRIIDTLEHSIDEILPITGSTGIGKTYLLLYCLKTYYNVDDIPTNHPVIYCKDGSYDLVYYSDFNITEQSILKDATSLTLAKIEAMYECILKQNFFEINDEPDVDEYIQNRKLEVKYYSDDNVGYQKALYRLTALLSNTPIKNVVLIFDDLESLSETQQFSLMENFLTLYENFKAKSERKYRSKFIFCLRNSTYYNIYRQDFYNTHRASKASHLSLAPSLSQIFQKRFDIILQSEKVKKTANKATWNEAKDILIRVADRVDSSYTNLLLKLNNNNISNALDDFLSIISNRRWTQKNVNPSASFKIEAEDYYINDINIMRILSMGERSIYYQTNTVPIRCILPKPGVVLQDDLVAFLVLRVFRFNNSCVLEDNTVQSKLLSINEVADLIKSCIIPENGRFDKERVNKIGDDIDRAVQEAFSYYEDNRFIRKNVDPRRTGSEDKYFMQPRGEQIFDLFFSQTILFTIFRDAFFWDKQTFDARCSVKMRFEDITREAIKYANQLREVELMLHRRIVENRMLRAYIANFGIWSVAESFLSAIKNSITQYYKDTSAIPDSIQKELNEAEQRTKQLSDTFRQTTKENSWFE